MQVTVELIYLILQGGLYTCIVCELFRLLWLGIIIEIVCAISFLRRRMKEVTCVAAPRLHVRLPDGCGEILLGELFFSEAIAVLHTAWLSSTCSFEAGCQAWTPCSTSTMYLIQLGKFLLLQFMLFIDLSLVIFTTYGMVRPDP